MSIEQDLRKRLTAAMKAKDSDTANTIRMINTKVMERRTAKGFKGEVDDALYLDVIAAYKKSLDKAAKEYAAAGERGKEHLEELTKESAFWAQFLPEQMSEDAVRDAVKAAIAELNADNPKMTGRVIGAVMKQHKGLVDAAVVKSIVSELLAPKS